MKFECTSCGARVETMAAHERLPRLSKRWWQISDSQAGYRCPLCSTRHRLAVTPLGVALYLLLAGGAIAAIFFLRGRLAIAALAGAIGALIAKVGMRAIPLETL
jgi:hypothetical protein